MNILTIKILLYKGMMSLCGMSYSLETLFIQFHKGLG